MPLKRFFAVNGMKYPCFRAIDGDEEAKGSDEEAKGNDEKAKMRPEGARAAEVGRCRRR